jgi:cobyrinic acid a,c-diamide synthase
MSSIPRVVVSAPSSGHGKTAVAVGLLAALSARGIPAAGFKIGPDYIDAAYLGLASGRPGRNLDPRLVGADQIPGLFAHGASGAEIAVVEGTMGLYDGLAGQQDAESTAQVAGMIRSPVVLVIDAATMGQSIAALVHGFRGYDEITWLGGVILNRVASDRHEDALRDALSDINVPVLGALRRGALAGLGTSASLPSRYEGVGPVAQRALEAERAVRRLGEAVARSVDLERVLALARSAARIPVVPWSPELAVAGASIASGAIIPGTAAGRRPVIAVAGGPGLSFGYVETIELLRAAGADTTIIDPIRDASLPDDVDALVVGGGMPEIYAEDLSGNESLRHCVAAFARAGKPIVAEGTGLVWLCSELSGRPMCGVIDAKARFGDLTVLGYRHATAVVDSVLMSCGQRVTGHKMHRTLISPRSGTRGAWIWAGSPEEGFVWNSGHASYLSLHWAGVPAIPTRLVAAAAGLGAAAGLSGGAGTPAAPPAQVAPSPPPLQTAPSLPPMQSAPPVPAVPSIQSVLSPSGSHTAPRAGDTMIVPVRSLPLGTGDDTVVGLTQPVSLGAPPRVPPVPPEQDPYQP